MAGGNLKAESENIKTSFFQGVLVVTNGIKSILIVTTNGSRSIHSIPQGELSQY